MLRRTPEGDVIDVPEDEFSRAKEVGKRWLGETEEGRVFAEQYNTRANVEKLRQQIVFHNLDVDFVNLGFVFRILRDSGQFSTEHQEQAAREAEAELADTRPKDKNGHPLSASQIEWRNFAAWANDPNTTSKMIAERRRTSASFNKFYVESLKREMTQTVDGAVPEPPSHIATAAERAELEAFAQAFLHAPASCRQPISGYVTLDGRRYLYSEFVKLVDRCASARLI